MQGNSQLLSCKLSPARVDSWQLRQLGARCHRQLRQHAHTDTGAGDICPAGRGSWECRSESRDVAFSDSYRQRAVSWAAWAARACPCESWHTRQQAAEIFCVHWLLLSTFFILTFVKGVTDLSLIFSCQKRLKSLFMVHWRGPGAGQVQVRGRVECWDRDVTEGS